MTKPEFIYTTYIKTTAEKLWQAISTPEFTRQYWGDDMISDWKTGAAWKYVRDDEKHETIMLGTVVESTPPQRLVLTWMQAEDESDTSRVSFEIETIGDMVRLTVLHDSFVPGSTMLQGISSGWPRVLASLKTFLENGTPLDTWLGHENSCHASAERETVA